MMPVCRLLVLTIAFTAFQSHADSCEPKSDFMRLVKTCYTGDMAETATFGSYKDAAYNSGNGVNFCYNTLAFLSREGARTKVEVVHENARGELRSNIYNFDKKAVYAADKNVVVLKDLEAKCFAVSKANDHCGGWFSGSNNIPVAITLEKAADESFRLEGYTSDRNLIKDAQAQGVNATGDFNSTRTMDRVLSDIRARIMAKSKALLEPKNIKTAKFASYRACVGQFNDTFIALQRKYPKLADPYTKEDGALLGKVIATYGWGSKNNAAQVPAAGQPASSAAGKKD